MPIAGRRRRCAHADDRLSIGWLSNGVIGFSWEASQNNPTFLYPYVYIARFHQGSSAFLDAPILWSTDTAWLYADVTPNLRGHLGIVVFCSGGSLACEFPDLNVGIWDDITTNANHWELHTVRSSTNGPVNNLLGDFVRVRDLNSNGYVWQATGWTLLGGWPVLERGSCICRVRTGPRQSFKCEC
jgi:hypothetical protein